MFVRQANDVCYVQAALDTCRRVEAVCHVKVTLDPVPSVERSSRCLRIRFGLCIRDVDDMYSKGSVVKRMFACPG